MKPAALRPGRWSILGVVLVLIAVTVFGGAVFLHSQDIPTLSVDVKVINVLASVRTRRGDIVRNLNKEDFTLSEEGRPQNIRYFSRQSDLPLTLGLLVDTSTSQRRVLGEERDASAIFLDQLLRLDRDNAFVLHFDFDVELLQDLTSSRQKLRAALDLLELPERGGPRPGGGGRRSGRRSGGWRNGGTALYDAIFLASDELMLRQQGRKAVIVLSDGVDTGSQLSLSDAIEAAQRADTMVYSILFSDASVYGGFGRGGIIGFPFPQIGGRNGKKVLQQLSKETGGRFFEVSEDQSIRQIYASIQEELRNQYNIGYSSDKPYDGSYRKIRLAAKSKDLVVQAREGYYARK